MAIYLCSGKMYQYKGFTFEYGYTGVHKLKRNLEPAKKEGMKFFKVIGEFMSLSDEKKEDYRIRGGCERYEFN